MVWKQPIDTDLARFTKGNVFAATVLMELIRRASNIDREIQVNDTWISVKRGQCIVGRFELAKYFGLKKNEASRIQRILDKLENTYQQIHKRKSKDCSIITILNYDSLVQFDQSNKQSADNP